MMSLQPHLTEKSLTLATKGFFTFRVSVLSRKEDIVKAINTVYGVNVLEVRTSRQHGKMKRVGKLRQPIQKSDWKKACVRLKAGQRIDAFDVVPKKEAVKK
jgi:ribosomal protein L23